MKTRLIPLLLLLLLSLILPACQATPTATPATPTPAPTATLPPPPTVTPTPVLDQGTISIWHSLEEPDISTLVLVIADFQNLYPDIQFDVLYLPENILLERYAQAAQEGGRPSILLAPAAWMGDLAQAGLVADLTGLLDASLTGRINAAALETGRIGGFQIGLPYQIEGTVLFRNNDLIPDVPATWEDLAAAAQAVTQGEVVGAYLERGFYYAGAHLQGLGGALQDAAGQPAFNNEAGRQWLELLQAFAQVGPVDYLTSQDVDKFKALQVGFVIDSTTNREALISALGYDDLSIDPWPVVGAGRLAGYLQAQAIFLNSHITEDVRQISWKFAHFMLSPEAQARFSKIGRIPAVLDAPLEDPLIAQAVTALRGNVAAPANFNELYQTAMDTYLPAFYAGESTVQETLDNIEAAIRAALSGQE